MRLIHALDEAQTRELHALFQGEWWTKGRALEDVRAMLRGTNVVVAFEEEGSRRLAAFARLLSDGVYRAFLYDVVVRPDLRRTGLGERLLRAALAHPDVAGVEQVALGCRPELVPFYERFGFRAEAGGNVVMRRAAG